MLQLEYLKATEAYGIGEYRKYFDELCQRFLRVAKYIKEDMKFEKWSRAYFQGNRFKVMTINIVETINNLVKVAREFPKEIRAMKVV